MATTPYFHCSSNHSSTSALASDVGPGALEMTLMAPATADTAPVALERAVARPRTSVRRNSSGSGKQKQQQQAGGGAKKPPQRGLGVAELERLRCGVDPLRELGLVSGGDAGGQTVLPLLHWNNYHHHHDVSAPTFDAANARNCTSSLLVQPPPPPPAAPGCYIHHPPPTACGRKAASLAAPEQQYFMDRWGRMGGFTTPTTTAGNGSCAGGDHHAPLQLAPPLAPEHPSSQSTIWRPAASYSSSCLQAPGHRCDHCARKRMTRAFSERSGASPPPPPAPPSLTANAMPDYSIYDLATAMTTARQGETAFLPWDDRKPGALVVEAPAKREVREIEFFPAATPHHSGGDVAGLYDESESVAPRSSSYGTGSYAAVPEPLDLSLRL